ncbi:MAG: hypothetical protein ABJE95_13135 [Byssovorax sp.]
MRAADQLAAAEVYLEERRPGAGWALHDLVEIMTAQIIAHPRSFPRVPAQVNGEVRRGLIDRYGYWLIFEMLPAANAAVVLSVWPTRRRPDGWRLDS